jgi:hypothetical protein
VRRRSQQSARSRGGSSWRARGGGAHLTRSALRAERTLGGAHFGRSAGDGEALGAGAPVCPRRAGCFGRDAGGAPRGRRGASGGLVRGCGGGFGFVLGCGGGGLLGLPSRVSRGSRSGWGWRRRGRCAPGRRRGLLLEPPRAGRGRGLRPGRPAGAGPTSRRCRRPFPPRRSSLPYGHGRRHAWMR